MPDFSFSRLRLTLLILFSCSTASAGMGHEVFIRDSEVLSEARADYSELRDLALRIFAKCPPQKCLYVGIGQSPAPLLALIESITGDETISIPLSDVRQIHNLRDPQILSEIQNGMRRHLSQFLNADESRDILVTDFAATTAASMTFAFSSIKEFFPNNGVFGFAMTAYGPKDKNEISIQRLEAAGIDYRQAGTRFYNRIHERRYRSLNRVSKYDVMKLARSEYEPAAPLDPARFQLLVDAFRKLSQTDLRLRKYQAKPARPGVLNSCRYLLELPSRL